jgi:transposase InsO family protein
VFTREIVDVNMLRYHNRFVGLGALEAALTTYAAPEIVHSDQGSEYDSADFVELVASCGAQLSMRAKGAPWQNGDKESFSSHFNSKPVTLIGSTRWVSWLNSSISR